jgi:hypothetical protein
MSIPNLKAVISKSPELVDTVEQLENDHRRLTRMVFDLNRLDEALELRVKMFESIPKSGPVGELADNCQQLLVVIRSFLKQATSVPADRAKDAVAVYEDLMKRMNK